MPTPQRSRRRDAARNRDDLLEAAQRLFAEDGAGIALESVARAAGVSRMTLYRHFPTRDELVAAVLDTNVVAIEQHAITLRGMSDGAARLFAFVVDSQFANRGLAAVLANPDDGLLASLAERTAAAFDALLREGHEAGTVWPDITSGDILLALHMAASTRTASGTHAQNELRPRVGALLHRSLFRDLARPANDVPPPAPAS